MGERLFDIFINNEFIFRAKESLAKLFLNYYLNGSYLDSKTIIDIVEVDPTKQ